MTRGEREYRALRREMLLARAAAERAALTDQLDTLETRSHSGVAGALLGGARRVQASGWLGVAAAAVRIARSQPWVVPAVAGAIAKLARSRTLRWVALAGVVGVAVWWLRKGPGSVPPTSAPGETAGPLTHNDAE